MTSAAREDLVVSTPSGRVRVAILGCTGSIGLQALDVARQHADRVEVVALAANSSAAAVAERAAEFGVKRIALADPVAAAEALELVADGTHVGSGAEAVAELAELPEVDVVLNALVGSAGLRVTMTALQAGKTLALANKESLVAGGELVTALATPQNLIPVDSEHSAIYQCFVGEDARDVRRIWLTASGGPFRGRSLAELAEVTPEQALAHPTWTMGPKITIDSATLANKGLEVIEAHHLFGVGYDDIRVVVHPQSIVHSMVEFDDASVKAHLGTTDMRIPIQYAFSHPRRWDAPVEALDFVQVARLDFADPDLDAFPMLALAFAAGRAGGTMPAVMNAANEVAVAAFLGGQAGFLDIPRAVEAVMAAHDAEPLVSIEQVEDADAWARDGAAEALGLS